MSWSIVEFIYFAGVIQSAPSVNIEEMSMDISSTDTRFKRTSTSHVLDPTHAKNQLLSS